MCVTLDKSVKFSVHLNERAELSDLSLLASSFQCSVLIQGEITQTLVIELGYEK